MGSEGAIHIYNESGALIHSIQLNDLIVTKLMEGINGIVWAVFEDGQIHFYNSTTVIIFFNHFY
jgi:hypothetical protein